MSAPKFTPGPWRIFHYPQEAIYVGPCELIGTSRRVATAEDHANAHLLAAAPELFAALRDAESEFDGAVRFYRNEMAGFVGASIVERLEACARKARAALRKAEGGAT